MGTKQEGKKASTSQRPRNLSLGLVLSSSTFFHSSALGFPRTAKRSHLSSDSNAEGLAAAAETVVHRPHTGVPGAVETS